MTKDQFTESPWHIQAQRLLDWIVSRYDEKYGFSSMSGSIYDTAWVSLVSKTIDGKQEWIFPECFQFVFASQLEDGGWAKYGDPFDRLMNTLAALLSLAQHRKTSLWPGSDADITEKMRKASDFLTVHLLEWDVTTTDNVGFELLIPAMLGYLEDEGFLFEFPGKVALYELNAKKMAIFHPAIIYNKSTTLLHSLEGFIGKVDFDKLKHHVVDGSLMASPSSTAAYLMNCSVWDEESEKYLRHVVQNCRPYGEGAVPSAFPTTVFELSWVICNLFENGFRREFLSSGSLRKITSILEIALAEGNGLVGFAPGLSSDADDTAKTIVALHYLGVHVSLEALVTKYEANNHFRTYELERNPSFTVNCNVLLALLRAPELELYQLQVVKTVSFLCDRWWTADGKVEEKWHLSQYYSFMLLSQAVIRFLHVWGKGHLPKASRALTRHKIPIMLMQVLLRTLHTQAVDSSFGSKSSLEETAYAIIALANLASLPFIRVSPIYPQVEAAISNARAFLRRHGGTGAPYINSTEYLWVEKVTYASDNLHGSYILGAMNVPVPTYTLPMEVETLAVIPFDRVHKFTSFYSRVPLFSEQPTWKLQGSLMEAYLFLPELSRIKLDVFDRKGFREDKYLEYIPFSWVGPSNLDGTFLGSNLLFDLSLIALLNYQVDEYIEAVIGITFSSRLEDVIRVVKTIFAGRGFDEYGVDAKDSSGLSEKVNFNNRIDGHSNSRHKSYAHREGNNRIGIEVNGPADGHENGDPHGISFGKNNGVIIPPLPPIPKGMSSVYRKLSTFVETVLNQPRISNAHPHNKKYLVQELRAYLLAQVSQGVNNERFRRQKVDQRTFETPHTSYRKWARGAASEHVSCHYAFAFLVCLLSHQIGGGEDCFPTQEMKYVAEDCCSHLAALCRMYNDYGSINRDRDEGNINSINFPEFSARETEDSELKKKLMRLAQYERRCLENGMKELEILCGKERKRVFQVMRMYCNTVDFYGQLYVLKDLTCRI